MDAQPTDNASLDPEVDTDMQDEEDRMRLDGTISTEE